MGQHISCSDNYYCQSIDYQPDWFSASHYSIQSFQTKYSIERGILHILPSSSIHIILSKEISLQDIDSFRIPIFLKYSASHPIHLIISLKNKDPNSFFTIEFIFDKNDIFIKKNNEMVIKGKIKENAKYHSDLYFVKKETAKWDFHFSFKKDKKIMIHKIWQDIDYSFVKNNILSFEIQNENHSFLSSHHFSLSLDSF